MARADREHMIEQYLGGAMPHAQEQEFFLLVAVDPELRRTLKAHRAVENAIRKDRDAEPAMHTALRGRVATMLAASQASAAGQPNPPAPILGGAAQTSGRIFGMQQIIGAVTAILLGAATFAFHIARFPADNITTPVVVQGANSAHTNNSNPTPQLSPDVALPAASIQQDTRNNGELKVVGAVVPKAPVERHTRTTPVANHVEASRRSVQQTTLQGLENQPSSIQSPVLQQERSSVPSPIFTLPSAPVDEIDVRKAKADSVKVSVGIHIEQNEK